MSIVRSSDVTDWPPRFRRTRLIEACSISFPFSSETTTVRLKFTAFAGRSNASRSTGTRSSNAHSKRLSLDPPGIGLHSPAVDHAALVSEKVDVKARLTCLGVMPGDMRTCKYGKLDVGNFKTKFDPSPSVVKSYSVLLPRSVPDGSFAVCRP